jgi:hypothetical protein
VDANADSPMLHCLSGEPGPPDVANDIARIADLPAPARASFWHVLSPSLSDPVSPDTEKLLTAFASTYRLNGEALAHAIKACRFLLREAARVDLSPEKFAEDLEALRCAPELAEMLLGGYTTAIAAVRLELVRGALTDHGRLVIGADWRIDTMEASNRANKMRVPVAVLTLRFRDGDAIRRETFHLMPDMIGHIKAICERMLA